MIITKRRNKYRFVDSNGRIRRFKTQDEAVAAGGKLPEEEVQVSGVPYKVPASSINNPSTVKDVEETEDESPEEDGED